MERERLKQLCQFCMKDQKRDHLKLPISRLMKQNFYQITQIKVNDSESLISQIIKFTKLSLAAQHIKIQWFRLLWSMSARVWSCRLVSRNTCEKSERASKLVQQTFCRSFWIGNLRNNRAADRSGSTSKWDQHARQRVHRCWGDIWVLQLPRAAQWKFFWSSCVSSCKDWSDRRGRRRRRIILRTGPSRRHTESQEKVSEEKAQGSHHLSKVR